MNNCRLLKGITLVLSFLFLISFTIPSFAAQNASKNDLDNSGKKYETLILDEEDLLSDEEEALLIEEMEKLLPYGNVIFSSVYLTGSNFESHCEQTYYNFYGYEPGVILQIDMGNRKITLSASTEMENLIGKERDSIVDNIYRYASRSDYYGCAKECYHEIDLILHDGQIAHSMKYIDNAIFALILGLILNFLFIFASSKKKVTPKKVLGAAAISMAVASAQVSKGRVTKKYDPRSSGGGGSSGGSSGGGGGGGFSGGSSSHGF